MKTTKVTLAFLPHLWRIPQICCNCGQNSPPYNQADLLVIENLDWTGKRQRHWKFKFPYCMACVSESKKGQSLFSALKREHAAVEANFVQSKKYGGFLSKKEAKYLDFEFKNDHYATLFKEANKDLLFDDFFKKLQQTGG